MIITRDQLRLAFPRIDLVPAQAIVAALNKAADAYGIDTPKEMAAWVAQMGVESANFTRLEENLNYSAKRLVEVFHTAFPTLADAQPYAHIPRRIANRVYANRLGNGNESSGDGWQFRGRSWIQLTGRANYSAFKQATGKDVLTEPEYLCTFEGSARCAAWFWRSHRCDDLIARDDFDAITRIVNGRAMLGAKERRDNYHTLLKVLDV